MIRRLRLRRCLRVLSRGVLLGLPVLVTLWFAARDGERPATAAAGYTIGVENSWIRVQNIGQGNANLEIDYFSADGLVAGNDLCPSATCPPMYPGSGWTFFQKNNPNLPPGFQGSAVLAVDQPVVAVIAREVFRGDHFSIDGATASTGPGSHRLYLPVVAKRDGGQGDWMGRFVVQNMSDTVAACLTITYLNADTDDESAWEPYRPGANNARLPGCPNGGMPLAPRGSLFRDPDSMPVPNGFTGAVRIDLAKNGAGQGPEKQFITANADTWNRLSSALGSYRGLDENELGTNLVLPLMDRQVGPGNSYSTYFQIENKNPPQPAAVTLRFDGYDLNQSPPGVVTRQSTFTVKGTRVCYQAADDASNCLSGGERLPFNFVGTAKITSTQPIAVVVNRATTVADTFTDYRGIRPDEGARRVLLPLLNRNYGFYNGAHGWNSWFRVMAADGGHANVVVHYYGIDLPGGSVSYALPVDREATVFQYLDPAISDGFAGTAILESDRPIVALADVYTDVFSGDPDFLYNGIPLDQTP